jgi:hypothetical protein
MLSAEAIIGDVRHGALKNPMLNAILKEFGSQAFRRCSVMMEFEHFVRRIGLRGRTCLEIGTYNGISAVLLTQFFERVVCVSVDENPERLLKRQIAAHLGLTNKLRFFDCADNDEKAAVISQLDFDACYQDGDHANDTRADFALVERCGRVLLHEYWPIQPPVWNLVNSLPEHEVIRAEFDCFAYWQRGGVDRPSVRAWCER